MGNCIVRTKVKPTDFDDLRKIGSVHIIKNLSDLKLEFIDDTPKNYTVRVVDTLKKGEESV